MSPKLPLEDRQHKPNHSADSLMILLSISLVLLACSSSLVKRQWPTHLFFCLLTEQHPLPCLNMAQLSLAECDSWPLLLECVHRFYVPKLLHWRLVPPVSQQLCPVDGFLLLLIHTAGLQGPLTHLTGFSAPPQTSEERRLPPFFSLLSHSFRTTLNLSLCSGNTEEPTPVISPPPSASFPTVWELLDEPVSSTSL